MDRRATLRALAVSTVLPPAVREGRERRFTPMLDGDRVRVTREIRS